MESIFTVLSDILEYLVNLRIVDIPRIIAYTGVLAVFSYCAAMIVVGFPVAIYKDLAKKEVNSEKEDKVIKYVAICFFVIFSIVLLYEQATRS